MASDASHMLEAALEQMDDIIAGSKAAAEYTNGLFELGSPGSSGPLQVLQLVEDLRLALELQPTEEDRDALRARVSSSTTQMLMDWLDSGGSDRGSVNLLSPGNNESYQERLVRLEGDKESLVLQVSVLTDQVEAQGEKIRDLESSLEEHHHKLNSTEGMLQQELLCRTSLETQKLDLMDEVSYLKLKLVGMEEEQNHRDSREDQQNKAEGLLQELRLLKSKVDELEGEKSQYERKLKATKGEIEDLQRILASKDTEIKALHSQLVSRGPMSNEISDRGKHTTYLSNHEFQSLKMGMESLLAANDEKDRHIEELTILLGQYRKMKDVIALAQVSSEKLLVGSSEEELNGSLRMRAVTHKAHSDIIQSEVRPTGNDCVRCLGPDVFYFLYSRIKRSQSGGLQGGDPEPGEFKRGGVRATAGPRLARTGETDLKTPFSNWTPEQVCCWLEEFGLGQYVILSRHWVSSGHTLLSASPQDLEKEMGIKNPLHRKKLLLALKSFSTKLTEKSSELDHIWVTRWLDDIGLPQYKDQFHEGRVDGRMLQYLTVNDLLFLKVTSQLHHLSVKCAIHVLHVNRFNPYCLKRRPGDENQTSPSEVVQWSNHRVMEWLRSVDLAEYAPNLRGSGVHGGLIILEPRFNSDTLAMLLNIPPQKTLLRRHLATNFNMLVGCQAQQEKREYMESSGYNPLSTTAKVRPKKLGFSNFGHLRKKRCDDATDFICPLEVAQAQAGLNGAHRPYSGFRGLSPILDRDPDRREQVGPNS
uniref:SAM domain-containing protein n=1 Tax=Esox lucius TaxID=8010 RepID=A0A3P9A7E3_ESOLU